MKKKLQFFVPSLLLFAILSGAQAEVPRTLGVQGVLQDEVPNPGGPGTIFVPITGVHDITFYLYDAETGINPWHTEVISALDLGNDGIFSVILGEATSFDANRTFEEQYWLRIQVDAQTALPPIKLAPSPYSLNSKAIEEAFRVDLGSFNSSPNLIGGHRDNSIKSGVVGATISGGGYVADPNEANNEITDNYGTIGGGEKNIAGNDNSDTGDKSHITIGGGRANEAKGNISTIAGGNSITILGDFGAVGGGANNDVNDDYGTIGGGSNNIAGSFDVINTSNNTHATVGGGQKNRATGQHSTVGGGEDNQASGLYATVAGGGPIDPSTYPSNSAAGDYSTVGGGGDNRAGGDYSAVGGGGDNNASGDYNTIGGGNNNQTTGNNATIAGGHNNQATKGGTTIAGGKDNFADALHASVGGGENNQAIGLNSTVPGGQDNIAGGAFSFAAGRRAHANSNGQFVFADNNDFDYNVGIPNRFAVRATGGIRFILGIDPVDGTPTQTATLVAGATDCNITSDRNAKENIEAVDTRRTLEKIAALPIRSWNYITQDEPIHHIGPMAQDFYAAFELGIDDTQISSADMSGVALAAIQGLYSIVQDKDAQIEALRRELALLKTQQGHLTELETRLNDLEDRLPSTTRTRMVLHR